MQTHAVSHTPLKAPLTIAHCPRHGCTEKFFASTTETATTKLIAHIAVDHRDWLDRRVS